MLPRRRTRAGGGRARRARLPGLPAVALEAPAHQQPAGAYQLRDQAAQPCRAGVPVGEVAGTPCRSGIVRSRRRVGAAALLLGGQDGRALRRQAGAGALGRGGRVRAEDNREAGHRGGLEACRRDGGRVG